MSGTITVNYGTADGPVLEIPDGDAAKKWGVHPKAPLTRNQAWALVQDLPETPENHALLDKLIQLAGVLPGPPMPGRGCAAGLLRRSRHVHDLRPVRRPPSQPAGNRLYAAVPPAGHEHYQRPGLGVGPVVSRRPPAGSSRAS